MYVLKEREKGYKGEKVALDAEYKRFVYDNVIKNHRNVIYTQTKWIQYLGGKFKVSK